MRSTKPMLKFHKDQTSALSNTPDNKHSEEASYQHQTTTKFQMAGNVGTSCQMVVMPHNTINLLCRDILQRLGIHLTNTLPGEKFQNIHSLENNIAKWLFQKKPPINQIG